MHTQQGRSTIFGLNVNGTIDKGDNGKGAFGYDTRNKLLVGVSLPVEIVKQTIGDYRKADVWHAIHNKNYMVSVRNLKNGKTILASVVDLGPAEWTGNLVDLTYASDRHLETAGDGHVEVCIFGPDGHSLEFLGFKEKT